MGCRSVFLVFAVVAAASAQSVVSVRSGLLNYSEGAVFINNQPVKQQAGAYPALQDGSDLLTQSGRAEILLTPSAYLRIGQNSAIRMVSTKLTDTKVELLYGSAMLDSTEALDNSAITLVYKDRQVNVPKPGKYRIDSEPPQFRVFQGSVEIGGTGGKVVLHADQVAQLDGSPVVRRFTEGSDDLLDIWSDERHFLISSSLTTAKGYTDPANSDDSLTADADLGAYLGYVPPATIAPAPIAPLSGIYYPYPSPGLVGLGYGSYAGLGLGSPYIYSGIYSGMYLGVPRYGLRSVGGYYPVSPYTQIPMRTVTPGAIPGRPVYGYHPVGGVVGRTPGIVGRTPGIGVGVSPGRPVGGAAGAHPVPRAGVHR